MYQNPYLSNYTNGYSQNMSNPYLQQYPNQQRFQQPTVPTQQQQYDYEPPIQGVKFVTSDEAKAFIVMPNTKVMLMDRDNSIFYIKSADGLGKSTLEGFKYKKLENDTEKPKTEEIDTNLLVKKEDLSSFVTKDDLTVITDKLEQLRKQIKINQILDESKGEI